MPQIEICFEGDATSAMPQSEPVLKGRNFSHAAN
jgi:hypothetical protein